jgi:hypothetical protein
MKTGTSPGTIAASVNYNRNVHALTIIFTTGKLRKLESMYSILWYTKLAAAFSEADEE